MIKQIAVALAAVAGLVTFTSSAHAEDFSLHLEPGAAMAVSRPQYDTFRVGIGGSAKLLFPLVPNLAVGPTVSVLSLDQKVDNTQTATLWGFGATARLQGKRSASILPWVDVTGSVDKQGSLFRPGLATALGLEFSVDHAHTIALGPWVGYQHTFENTYKLETNLLPHRDANVVLAGISLSFDGPPAHTHTNTVTLVPVVVEKTVTVPGPVQTQIQVIPVLVPTTIHLKDKVAFAKDSAVLSSEAQTWLTTLADKLNTTAGQNFNLELEGHASAEGDATHNLLLSQQRAQSVVAFLVAHGVAQARLSVAAVGAVGQPNDAANRSVEVIAIRVTPFN